MDSIEPGASELRLPTGGARASIEYDGHSFSIRSMTRTETLNFGRWRGDETKERDAEIFLLSCSFDISLSAAGEWIDTADNPLIDFVLDECLFLSGIKKRPKDPDPKP